MDGVLRLLLAVIVGAVAATGVPREIGREFRWVVTWDQSLEADDPEKAIESMVETSVQFFPVETDRRFFLIDGETGDAVATGLKTQVFSASSQAMINQATDAPRWAVQSWNGRMLRVVPRRGAPRLHGTTLLQFAGDSFVYGDVVTRGERWELELPKNPTVYDLAHEIGGGEWFAVGALGGIVAVTDGDGGRKWDYTLESTPDTATTPAIYGIRVVTAGQPSGTMVRQPSVHILHSLDPQVVSRLDFEETGSAARTQIGQIPDEYAVRGPRSIFGLGQNLLVIGLDGALFVAFPREAVGATVPIPGITGLSGMGRAGDNLVVATGRGQMGPLILVGASDMSEVAHWELADGASMASTSAVTPLESIVVVQREDRLIGLKISL